MGWIWVYMKKNQTFGLSPDLTANQKSGGAARYPADACGLLPHLQAW